MNEAEALAKARERWGPQAQAGRHTGAYTCCWVSSVYLHGGMIQGGSGDTFEAAFADADRRLGK